MKFTQQTTIDREFITYSRPYSKEEIIEFMVRTGSGMEEEDIDSISKSIAKKTPDAQLVNSFNRIMNIKIRSFAPGLFQVKYSD